MGLENPFRPAGTDIDEIQRVRAEIGEIGPAVQERSFGEHPLQESVGEFGNGDLVVQARSDRINRYHMCYNFNKIDWSV